MEDTIRYTIGVLLRQEPGAALCDACLAFASSTSLMDVRAITESLVHDAREFQRASMCVSCRRTVPTTVARAKCAHCSEPLDDADAGELIGGEVLHVHCVRRLIADGTIRPSRALSHRARQAIEESRHRMRERRG